MEFGEHFRLIETKLLSVGNNLIMSSVAINV